MAALDEESSTAASVSSPAVIVLSDEPRLSSAALSTTLRLGSTTEEVFHPEFTHQCVGPSESFRGHRPFSEFVQRAWQQQQPTEATQNVVLHKSHLSHPKAAYECKIDISLAPSCRSCQVHIQRRSIKNMEDRIKSVEGGDNEPKAKKVKFDPSIKPAPKEEAPLSDQEIQDAISKALPSIRHATNKDSDKDNTPTIGDQEGEDYLTEPMGTVVQEYTVPQHKETNDGEREGSSTTNQENNVDNDTHQFVITVASPAADASAAAYHTEVQKLASWFIENADDVDVADDQTGGYWKVLYIFQKHRHCSSINCRYSLVGYVTLFHFQAPFHKPTPGIVVRICQALVLPPFQGQGHGKKALQCVYDSVMHQQQAQDQIPMVQVNVEDPAPGFVALRNKVDLKFLADHSEWWPVNYNSSSLDDKEYFSALLDAHATEMSSKAKITARQVQIVNELVKLKALLQLQGRLPVDASNGAPSKSENCKSSHGELETRFRLMVKKRLNRENREEMNNYPTKEEKKVFLAKLFDQEYQSYLLLVGVKERADKQY